jgi:hypothetical protein
VFGAPKIGCVKQLEQEGRLWGARLFSKKVSFEFSPMGTGFPAGLTTFSLGITANNSAVSP